MVKKELVASLAMHSLMPSEKFSMFDLMYSKTARLRHLPNFMIFSKGILCIMRIIANVVLIECVPTFEAFMPNFFSPIVSIADLNWDLMSLDVMWK